MSGKTEGAGRKALNNDKGASPVVNVRLPRWLHQALGEYCERHHLTPSMVMRTALIDHFTSLQVKVEKE